jgi:hypothetical protein
VPEYYQVPCPGCGYDRTIARLGLKPDGTFIAADRWTIEIRARTYGGRGRLVCEHRDLPLPLALGLRDMLRARLTQIEAELAAAGVEG